MRVLRLIARLNVGGPARHVVCVNEAIAGDGFEPLLVTGTVLPGEEDMSGFAVAHGVTPLVLPRMTRDLSLRDLITIVDVWRIMVRFGPDVVHTHTAKAGAVGRLAGLLYRFATPGTLVGRPRRCHFVHTYHGHVLHGYYGPWASRLFAAVERALAWLNTDRLIVLGPQQLQEIRDRFGIGRPPQFVIVPLGIDLADVLADAHAGEALRSSLGIAASEKVVGIVGRLTAIKNHELFLRVAARGRDGARFVVYGDGAERARLEQRAADLGLGDRVVFAGTRPAPGIYSSVDVVALTSRNEGTPLTLIEAMASGRPVISTAVGGVVDLLGPVHERVVEQGAAYEVRERGIAAMSDDEAGFAAGLSRMLRDEPLRRRLIECGRAYVERVHSKDRLIADLTRLYRELEASGR